MPSESSASCSLTAWHCVLCVHVHVHACGYARCDAAYLVPLDANWTRVLEQLRMVGKAEARRKRETLRRIRDAFYWRAPADRQRMESDGDSGAARPGGEAPPAPSAVDYVLAEACEAGRRMRRGQPVNDPVAHSAARLARCALGGRA